MRDRFGPGGGKIYWAGASGSPSCGLGWFQHRNPQTGLETPVGIALDVDGGKIYWTDAGGIKSRHGYSPAADWRFQHRPHHRSKNPRYPSASELRKPSARSPDWMRLRLLSVAWTDGGKIYWTNEDRGVSSVRTWTVLKTLVTGLIEPFGIARCGWGKIFWTGPYEIQRANLDGSNIKTLVTGVTSLGIADVAGGQYTGRKRISWMSQARVKSSVRT